MNMIIIVSAFVIGLLILLLSKRYQEKMAALITWFIGSTTARWLIGSREEKREEPTKQHERKPESKTSSNSQKSKLRGRKKQQKDPEFSTKLSAPSIENILGETIQESITSSKEKRKSGKSPPKSLDSTKRQQLEEPDNIGYSFFKLKSNSKREEKNVNKSFVKIEPTEKSSPDDVGFSFLPVKERGKRYKNNSDIEKSAVDTLQSIIEKSVKKSDNDLSKSQLIEHFKYKRNKNTVIEPLPVVTKKFTSTLEKVQHFAIDNTLEEKTVENQISKPVFKECKKVTSSLSYASAVTNKTPETDLETNSIEKTDSKFLETNINLPETVVEVQECSTDSEKCWKDLDIENDPEKSAYFIVDSEDIDKQEEKTFEEFLQSDTSSELLNGNSCVQNLESCSSFETNSSYKSTVETSFEKINVESKDTANEEDEKNLNQVFGEKSTRSISFESEFEILSLDNLKNQTGSQKVVSKLNKQESDFEIIQYNLESNKEVILNTDFSNSVQENLSQTEVKDNFAVSKSSTYPDYSTKGTLNSDQNKTESKVSDKGHLENPLNQSQPLLIDETSSKLIQDQIESEIISEEKLFEQKKIIPQPKNYSKEVSAKFIQEEQCVKKIAYITEEDTEIPLMSEKINLEQSDLVQLNIKTMQQVRVLTLNDKEHQECTLYRLENNWTIQFRIGPSLFGRKVYLYCNYPKQTNEKLEDYDRNKYQLLPWMLDEGCKNADDTAAYTHITVQVAGSFHYYFTFTEGANSEKQGSGYFLVDPILKYGNNEDLPLDCIQCQTILTKGLGSFSSWEKKLLVAKESGYNMIHFTPIQELGISNSSYSLREQQKLNPVFKKDNGEIPTFEEIEEFIAKIRKDWKVTSICDIVLNHTANESEWIRAHPEVTYNCQNCPYMRPAYLLDAAIHQFSLDVKKGLYEDKGIPTEINSEEHLTAIRYHFNKSVLEPLNIPELFTCNVNKYVAEFLSLARTVAPRTIDYSQVLEELTLEQDSEYKRSFATVDLNLALQLYNIYRNDTFDEESRLKKCAEEFKNKLDSLNNAVIEEVKNHLSAAIENVIAAIRYFRVQADGPKFKEITIKTPLVYRYFTDYGEPESIKEHEELMYSDKGVFLMAHNGWVMNCDPLKNFAAPDTKIYIRRELIAWGDSVKLRFGDKPEDCPFLWQYMREYVEQTAKIFDGVRLDNCHSTPLPVAEYLLDCARRVKPNLYVVAELFTNSDMTDNIFVNRLGITSLIREAMSAWDAHEEGRLVYRYGGYPVGAFYQPSVRPLVPSIAHALFLDLTHDNPSPIEKRSVFDLLPSSALVNMSCCASGSSRGYDELVPHHIHVVDETRQYTEWTDDENLAKGNTRYVTKDTGIISAKKAVNNLHFLLGKEGYNQVYVDQIDSDVVTVTRHSPDTHQSYILVAFTAFGHPPEDAAMQQRHIRPLRFEGLLDEIVLEATLSHISYKSGGSKYKKYEHFIKDSSWINGLPEYKVAIKQHFKINESEFFEKVDSGTPNVTQLNFKNFKPGSIVVIKASLPEAMQTAVKNVRDLISNFSLHNQKVLNQIIDKMALADLNRALYRCDKEERDEGYGFDTYNIPNFGFMVYAGLQGMISVLANVRPNNDLGHPMCANLRDGNWMIDYIWRRLKFDEGTLALGEWIEQNTKSLKEIPRYLIPCYFDVIVTSIYILLLEQCDKLMSEFIKHGSTFVRALSLGSVQMAAYIKSSDLPILSPNLADPKPKTRKNEKGEDIQACVTLSAGLPHFSVGYMRNWGRDTFIALRGLFILTGRYQEAREHILGYAACLRHGLIPNLLDGGRNSRFNCRDAVWWWLHCIQEYVQGSPNGISILSDTISRIFPTDDSPVQVPGTVEQPLHDVMQEALSIHFQGLVFRERNAGRQIDEHMNDAGFNNQIGIHPETGFVFGGNQWNCGTWMDKMGSSDKAGNRGRPATPRDGSAIELVGLSKAVVTWLDQLHQKGKYPYSGVERIHKNGSKTMWTFKEWGEKIQANFERYFWINTVPNDGEISPDLINKRGIYKDSHGSSLPWTDFQLRCNFPIAMVTSPELFDPQHAWIALEQAEKSLLGPLGMKTLDPEDWTYRGDYDNSNDSNDPSVANGFNYHQGPEWIWPIGFFLRAKLIFAAQNGALKETVASTKVVLSKHFLELQTSPWRGLAELTNSNGAYCHDSSRTQAWSMSCILEVLYDLQKIESTQSIAN